jgi:hypothetical protein
MNELFSRLSSCTVGGHPPTEAGGGGSSVRTISSGSKGSSGSGTPVRKISAHEFERGGLTKPLVTTIDGTPTFLSPPVSSEVTGQIRKRSRHDVQVDLETRPEVDFTNIFTSSFYALRSQEHKKAVKS